MESIFRLTRSNYYHLYVVDDCSPNAQYSQIIQQNSIKNAEKQRKENVVHVKRNEVQKGFAGACRVGFEMGESPYVCFVNSDCLIKDIGWLRNLGESLISLYDQGVRVVTPATNNAVGGDDAQQKDTPHSEDVIISENSHMSMYCFMCRRDLFNSIGGFLKEYPYGYFEDEEFASRLKKHGYKQAVAKKSWIYHEGQATIRPLWRSHPNIRDIMELENRNKCIEDMKKLK
jgi:GT2 family glycosyltransferase